MIRRAALALLLATLGVALPRGSLAAEGDRPPSAADRREAKRLFDQAHLAYQDGNYEEAILKWKRSFDLSGEPLIFEAIASAYEKLNDATKAHEYLTQWREHAPAAEHEQLDERLAKLAERMKAEQEQAEKDLEAKRREEERRKAQEEAERREREQEAKRAKPSPPPEEGPTAIQIASWSLLGVGAAAVVTGIIIDGVAASARPNESEACSERGDELLCRAALQDDIESSNTLAIAGDVTWIAGGAMAATGLVLLLTVGGDSGTSGEGSATTQLLPQLAPTSAGLTLIGTF